MSALVFDIGGTSLRMAIGREEKIENLQKIPTPESPAAAVSALVAYAQESIPDLTRISGAVAGVIRDGVVVSSPHLPEWDGFMFAEALSNALGVPASIRNDADLAALGEAHYGAGKGKEMVAYLGFGTGVGSSLVVHGRTAPHVTGFEAGHQIIESSTGATLERVVSGTALQERFGQPASELPRAVYGVVAPLVSIGIYNTILHWSPDVVVLGGSLMNEENGYRVSDISSALAAIPTILPSLPPLKAAILGDESALYGALVQE